MSKTAVILFNLGGPDSKEAIEPFLFNFFTDRNIIPLPFVFRWLLAKFISKRRANREAKKSYGELGNKSPLLENTRIQAAALEKKLGGNFKTFVCMRYWHPMAPEVIDLVNEYRPDHVVLLPLYPQFSTTTVKSAFENFLVGLQEYDGWLRAEWERNVKISAICCYPFNDGFIKASTDNIRGSYDQAVAGGHDNPRILFSAHGLPESVIKGGDPYQWQCGKTAEKIVAAMGIKNLDWAICYQSRIGPKKWIGPSLDEELQRAAQDNKPVIVYPHAFTQEHVETLVELDIEYREMAEELKLPGYYRAQTVSAHPAFIEGLAKLVHDHLAIEKISAEGGRCICPAQFGSCCMRSMDG